MISTVTPSLKEKLAKSRAISFTLFNEQFLKALYNILEARDIDDKICCWSRDGKLILIRDCNRFISDILPLFEGCPTFLRFLQKLEDCQFTQIFGKSDESSEYRFEHYKYNRYQRPPAVDLSTGMRPNRSPAVQTNGLGTDLEASTPSKKIKNEMQNDQIKYLQMLNDHLGVFIERKTQEITVDLIALESDLALSK